jgi:hypothetical protein
VKRILDHGALRRFWLVRAIERAFIASGAEVLSSAQIYSWTHARRRLGRRKTMPFGIYWGTLQALRATCDQVGRSDSVSGAPTLWRLRHTGENGAK